MNNLKIIKRELKNRNIKYTSIEESEEIMCGYAKVFKIKLEEGKYFEDDIVIKLGAYSKIDIHLNDYTKMIKDEIKRFVENEVRNELRNFNNTIVTNPTYNSDYVFEDKVIKERELENEFNILISSDGRVITESAYLKNEA